MKKVALFILLTSSLPLPAITSSITHRMMSTSPLLYKMIDYSKRQTSYEIEPIFSSMYDSQHTISNLTPLGKQTLTFDQQGQGDINPTWINLMSNNTQANYNSKVTFTPNFTESGVLLHWYNQFEKKFIDIKTALVQCKSEIEINEVGGGNGLNADVGNAQQAFTQDSWDYGKIGKANHVVGLDNIEIKFGGISRATSNDSAYNMFISGFGLIEAPTGTGTKSEWLFEPQVGSNHWGLGFGFESLVSFDDSLKFMISGNYRYLAPAWEMRSFDLLGNGAWSRYLSVQDTYGLPTAPATLGLPGINYLTQQAYINGRSEVNVYTRLQKHFRSCSFELSYNLLSIQKETIGDIKKITPNYGIYALTGSSGGSGGVTTSSSATINQDLTALDPIGAPVAITTDRFDKLSAAAGTYVTNTLATRLEIKNDNMIYGFGASIETAQSASAISAWSVWAKFEYLFGNAQKNEIDIDFPSELYDLDLSTTRSTHHPINMDDSGLPDDVISTVEDDFMDNKENFEFLDDQASIHSENIINLLQENLNTSSQDLFNNEISYNIDLQRKHITPVAIGEFEEELNPTIIVKTPTTLFKKENEIITPDEKDLDEDDFENDDFEDEIKILNSIKRPESSVTLFKKEDEIIIPDENDLDDEQVEKKPKDIVTTPTVHKTVEVNQLDAIREQPNGMFISKSISSPVDKTQQVSLKTKPIQQADKTLLSRNSKISNRKKAAMAKTIKAQSLPGSKFTNPIASKTIDVQSLYIDKEGENITTETAVTPTPQVISSPVEGSETSPLQMKIEPMKEAKRIELDHDGKVSKKKDTKIVEGIKIIEAKPLQVKTDSIPDHEILQQLNQSKKSNTKLLQEEKSLKRNEEPTPIKQAEQASSTTESAFKVISSPVEGSQVVQPQVKIEPMKEAKEIQLNHDEKLKKSPAKKSAIDIIKAEPIAGNESLKFINPNKANINDGISEEDILKKLDSTK